jgi:hypothetical protein
MKTEKTNGYAQLRIRSATLSKLKRIGKTTRLKLVEVVDLIADERLTRDREPAK